MTIDEILKHNNKLIKKINERKEQISELRAQIDGMKSAMIVPCQFCPYDGEFRCEACRSDNFAGFNVKEYPEHG